MEGLIIKDRLGTEPDDIEEIGHQYEQIKDAADATQKMSA